jgi:uncharacterized protein (TIGR02145 family)
MAGEITVNGRKKLVTLQKEFSEAFNYLFIAFIDIADKDKKGQVNQIDCSKSISEVRTRVSNEELSLNGRTLIKNIEKYFENELGIYCQIGVHNYQGKTLYIPTDDAFNNSGLTGANKWAAENGCAAIGKINLSGEVVVGEGNVKEIFKCKEVKIGNQIWMSENLNVDRFQNGDLIPEVRTAEEWEQAGKNKEPACCFFNNDPENGKYYGRLYNYFAVIDSRGIAPLGWKFANDKDWKNLERTIGLSELQIDLCGFPDDWLKKKLTFDRGSSLSFINNLNNIGLTVKPAGFRCYDGSFSLFGEDVHYFSPEESTTLLESCIARLTRKQNLCRDNFSHKSGMYVKIVKMQ